MVKRWYVYSGESGRGPLEAKEIRLLLRTGEVDPFDKVQLEGEESRHELMEVDEIFRDDTGLQKVIGEPDNHASSPAKDASKPSGLIEISGLGVSKPLDDAVASQAHIEKQRSSEELDRLIKPALHRLEEEEKLPDLEDSSHEEISLPTPKDLKPESISSDLVPKNISPQQGFSESRDSVQTAVSRIDSALEQRQMEYKQKRRRRSKRYHLHSPNGKTIGPLSSRDIVKVFRKLGSRSKGLVVTRMGSDVRVPVKKFVAAKEGGARSSGLTADMLRTTSAKNRGRDLAIPENLQRMLMISGLILLVAIVFFLLSILAFEDVDLPFSHESLQDEIMDSVESKPRNVAPAKPLPGLKKNKKSQPKVKETRKSRVVIKPKSRPKVSSGIGAYRNRPGSKVTMRMRYSVGQLRSCRKAKCRLRLTDNYGQSIEATFYTLKFKKPLLAKEGRAMVTGVVAKGGKVLYLQKVK